MSNYLFSSESVAEGHPDKLADQISDAILDEAMRLAGPEQVHKVRCACETMVTGNLILVGGEMANPDVRPDCLAIARQVAHDIGYNGNELGFDPNNCVAIDAVVSQSADIAQAVGKDEVKGAGDQGLMFGYACQDTPELMPLALLLSHKLMQRQAQLRRAGEEWLRPDAKSQVTVRYEDERPVAVTNVVLSTQHTEKIDGAAYSAKLQDLVIAKIIDPILAEANIPHNDCRKIVNPSGLFVKGGPQADAGLTGRKIVVDTYGGAAPHGGGAFSGKDPSKVDRSAAYMARYIAKNIVAAGQAQRCLVQLAYVIGAEEPVSMMVNTYGTGDDARLCDQIKSLDMTPAGIINKLNLYQPATAEPRWKYRDTAAYGHFGYAKYPWEDTSAAAELFS